MWTLILTMLLTSNYYPESNPAAAIHSVDGFTSEASCLRAGQAWLDQQQKIKTGSEKNMRAMCVKK